jgi:hypothetical protein
MQDDMKINWASQLMLHSHWQKTYGNIEGCNGICDEIQMNPMQFWILDRAITGIFCRMDTFLEHAPPICVELTDCVSWILKIHFNGARGASESGLPAGPC